MGYYDPYPTLQLDRPLALLGFFGSGVLATAMALCSLTGLNPIDLDAQVAHRLGRHPRGASPADRPLIHEARLRALREALGDRPFGVLALPWDLPADPRAAQLLRDSARTCYLRRDLAQLHTRVLEALASDPRRYPALGGLRPGSAHDLSPLLAPLRPIYEQAEMVIEAGARHPQQLAEELIERLSAPDASAQRSSRAR